MPAWPNIYQGIDGDTIAQKIIPIIRSVAAQRGLQTIDCHTTLVNRPELFFDGVHPYPSGHDSVAHIIYRNILGKPIMKLSDTLPLTVFDIGQARTPQVKTVTLNNISPNTVLDTVTFTKKTSWLTVTRSAVDPDAQIFTCSIDASTLPSSEKKYYDTVTIVSTKAVVPSISFRVMAWIRPAVSNSYITLLPETLTTAFGNSSTFSIQMYNQFNEPVATQGLATWSATGGSVNGGTYTAPVTAGTYRVIATSSGMHDTAVVIVNRFMIFPDTGHLRRMLVLENNGSPYTRAGNSGINFNYIGNEASVRPTSGGVSTISGQACTWKIRQQNDGIWFTDYPRDSFVSYGAFYIYTPHPRRVWVRHRNDEHIAIRINGVVEATGSWDLWVEKSKAFTLNAGVTPVLVKLYEVVGGNYLSVRFTDTLGVNIKGLSYLLSPDSNATATATLPVQSQTATSLRPFDLKYSPRGLKVLARTDIGCEVKIVSINGKTVATGIADRATPFVFDRKKFAIQVFIVSIKDVSTGTVFLQKIGL